jgi:hypothetical protein
MTIFYGGTKQAVLDQIICEHIWQGPCMDHISRYYKCTRCFCIDRDCTEKEYYDKINSRLYENNR